ncbi:ABC transporter substrate-binding protein [Dactylosporangium sp. CA-233914]|uniref:ABC transporter substrate-binding protein n=1 Tax=Dactylosporangium sp. CA-233914 TaxID=3239934 RepID=UPI003D9426C8
MLSRLRATAAISTALLIAAGASACTSASPSAEAGGAESGGTTTLRVTSLSLCNELSLYALDKGIFSKHGIDVKLVNVQSGSAGIAALQGGSTDVAFVSPQALLTAIQEGVDMKIISDGGETTKDSQGIIVNNSSGIAGPADLQGKTIAVNDLGGTIVTLIEAWIQAATGQKSTAKFVALGFADIEPAVENGKVDAGAVTAASVQKITASGKGKSIGNPTFEQVGATPNALYAVTSSWLSKNPKAAEKFVAAMQEAADAAKQPANNTEKFAILSKYCKTPAETLTQVAEIAYSGYIDMKAFDNAVQQFKKAGVLKPEFDAAAAVPEFARAK